VLHLGGIDVHHGCDDAVGIAPDESEALALR
jgi:hypothetical protein